jgi:2-polyprenyl-3-methyl-5-hydroxy-6-metoxy-1,4-benzoquinol methylase
VWATNEYRNAQSPGDIFLNRLPVMDWLKVHNVRTVLDAGCGNGRMLRSLKIKDPSLKITGMDIAENAIDKRMKDVFIQGCLWDDNDFAQNYDAIFCIDVLEHIPKEHIADTLINLSEHTNKILFISASMKDDVFGAKLLGEPLHLTVKDVWWWADKLGSLGMNADLLMASPSNIDAVLIK